MAVGGILAALAFIMAGLLQLKVNETLEPKPSTGNVFIHRIGNSSAVFKSDTGLVLNMEKNEWPAGNYTLRSDRTTYNVELREEKCGYVIGTFSTEHGESLTLFPYSCEKSENGMTIIYILADDESPFMGTKLYVLDEDYKVNSETIIEEGAHVNIKPGFISSPNYVIAYGNCVPGNDTVPTVFCSHNVTFFAQMGAAHVLNLENQRFDGAAGDTTTVIVRPNSVNMLWQIPQFFVITLGEVLFSVTGLEFSYSQAAPTMKSVLQVLWLLTIFFGNVIDMFISGTHIIHEPASEFFLYAFLMLVVICIFIAISVNYTYVNEHLMAEAAAKEDQAEIEAEKAANADTINHNIKSGSPTSSLGLHKRSTTLSTVSPSDQQADSKC